jgi:hypothetical protein
VLCHEEFLCVKGNALFQKSSGKLPAAPCHQGIKGVQTVIRLIGLLEAQRLFLALRVKGIYRIVPPEYIVMRHALEPLDGWNLLSELTSQAILF